MSNTELPTKHELAWPTLKVLESLGGSASIEQLSHSLAEELGIPSELLEIPHGNGPLSEFNFRALCARTELKSIGAVVENPSNGMWSITNPGRRVQDAQSLLAAIKDGTPLPIHPPPRPDDPDQDPLPTVHGLAWPTLKVLESLGGSASIEQLPSKLAEFLSLPDQFPNILHEGGPHTELEFRTQRACSYLKNVGAVEDPSRAIWRITDLGRKCRDERTLLDAIKNGTQLPIRGDSVQLPTVHQLAWPTLKILEGLGGRASIEQLPSKLAEFLSLPDEIIYMLHGDGPQTELEYRAGWARTDLKNVGAIEKLSRGVWRITNPGRRVRDERILVTAIKNKTQLPGTSPPISWRDEVLGLVRNMDPKSFQLLCKKVLIQSGFREIEIIEKTSHGDTLGSGILRISLISFHILFQFRRSTTSVNAAEIRDLRGAMVGRAEKGLFVTTGEFTDSAALEAVRNGAPVIDLISGIELCDLLKDLELGVSTKMVEEIEVDPEEFKS